MSDPELIVKSKQRVADHGEVYTPAWLVNDMLSLVQQESERIDFLVRSFFLFCSIWYVKISKF